MSESESLYYTAVNPEGFGIGENIKENSLATDEFPIEVSTVLESKDSPRTQPYWEDVDLNSEGPELSLPLLHKTATIVSEEDREEQPAKNTEISIEVLNPVRITENWLSFHYVFPVHSRVLGNSFAVNRRFSDLEWLNDVLIATFKGLSVPLLPPKKLKLLVGQGFLRTRKSEINRYLLVLSAHPVLRTSEPFILFLSCPDNEFSREKLRLEPPPEPFSYTDIEDAIDQLLSKMRSRLAMVFEMRILPFSKELSVIENHLNTIEVPTYSLSSSFSHWSTTGRGSSRKLQGMSFPHSALFYQINQEHKQLSERHLVAVERIGEEYCKAQVKLEALRHAFDSYKGKLSRYSELDTLIRRKFEKHSKASEPNKSYVYYKQMAEAQKQLEQLSQELENTENVLKKEYEWFRATRDQEISSLIDKTIECGSEKSSAEEGFWLEKKHLMLDIKF